MRIFFISTWSSSSGLAKATVLPHLEELAKFEYVTRIFYFSIEDHGVIEGSKERGKITHISLVRKKMRCSVLRHIIEHVEILQRIVGVANQSKPSLVFCRGAPAGIYGYHLSRKFQIPFITESFEPHAEYMRYAGVWSRASPKYIVQTLWERKIKSHASALITVSECYRKHLERKDRIQSCRLFNIPCWVDTDTVRFDHDSRIRIRRELDINDRTICVYVGKLGGLYYRQEAFNALSIINRALGNKLFVLVLTPDGGASIEHSLHEVGFAATDFHVRSVDTFEVSGYLSAADFAISFVKSTPYSQFCSPIKHGEYWACGLPVLLPQNVGEEASWAEEEKAGVTVDMRQGSSITLAMRKILGIVAETNHRERIREVARRRRGKAALVQVYRKILSCYARASSGDLT
jgi:hypothetical protein